MSWFANELGYGDEADFWGSAVCSMILILSFILSNIVKKQWNCLMRQELSRS